MICFSKPVLTEYKAQGRIPITCYMCHTYVGETYSEEKPPSSRPGLLHKDYYREGSVAKEESLVVNLKGLVFKTN
jgi:hypothetical protein